MVRSHNGWMREHFWRSFWVAEVVIFVVVAVVSWFVGVRSLEHYGGALVIAGVFLLVAELVANPDERPTVEDMGYRYGFFGPSRSVDDLIALRTASVPRGPEEYLRDLLVCLVPIIVGVLLTVVF